MKLKKNIAISGTGFVFDPTTGDSFSANEIGLDILELLKKGKDQDEILSMLGTEYDIGQERLENDLLDFLNHLKQLELLEDA